MAYISGAWDCFGAIHVEILAQARGIVRQAAEEKQRQAGKAAADDRVKLVVGLWAEEVKADRTPL